MRIGFPHHCLWPWGSRLESAFIEIKVESENIDAGLAEQAQLASGDVTLNELADAIFTDAACLGYARRLIDRSIGRDVRVKSRA